MTVTFDQEHGGGIYEITAKSRDQLAWEKAAPGRATGSLLTASYKLDDLYSLAFATMRRQGIWQGSEKELREGADLDIGHTKSRGADDSGEDTSDEDPTQGAPSNAS